MERGLVLAVVSVIGAVVATVGLGVALASSAYVTFGHPAAPAPVSAPISAVARAEVPAAPVVSVLRAHVGRARLDLTARPASVTHAKAPRVEPAEDLWTDEDAPTVAAVAKAAPIDPDEDLSDFDFDLGPRGGSDTGRRR